MNKCKGCQWYGKPYWSIINPCDNCPREDMVFQTAYKFVEKVYEIDDLKQEIDRLNNIINELEKWLEVKRDEYGSNLEYYGVEIFKNVLDKLKALKEDNK